MIRSFLNFLVFNAFVLLLPIFYAAASRWGSADEQLVMKIAGCLLAPLCGNMWYVLLSHLVFHRKSSYFIQFVILMLGYAGIALLLKERVIAF